ncbi:MAG: hypothetical protein ACOX2N_01005 [Peptococcia bacterium]
MARTTKIKVKKEIYEWAIKESQKDFEEIKIRFRNIESWLSQDDFPTFRQLKIVRIIESPIIS